jgi:hypothetical protein
MTLIARLFSVSSANAAWYRLASQLREAWYKLANSRMWQVYPMIANSILCGVN